MTNIRIIAALAAAFLLSTSGIKSRAEQAHSHAAPNGGQLRQIGPYEVELLVKGPEVRLFIVDEKEQQVDASKLSATAVVLAKGNQQRTIEFKPAKGNVLSADADFPVDGKFRATVTLKTGGQELGKGRYNVDVKPR